MRKRRPSAEESSNSIAVSDDFQINSVVFYICMKNHFVTSIQEDSTKFLKFLTMKMLIATTEIGLPDSETL